MSDTLEPTQGKVFIIVDRHPVHRSKKVKSGIEENHICLFFLPGYSPE
jgi:transposase